MAYMQRHRLTKVSDLDAATTWRYKLPALGQYTAIEMRINCDRYQDRIDSDVVYPLEALVSKIEMLAGGARALYSLTGSQADAMSYWDFRRPTGRRYRQTAETENHMHFFLLGGRSLYDKEYGWDFAKLGETYLEYTYDLKDGLAEGFEANDHDISLYGWRWMGTGAPSFKGYFRSRQLAQWETSAAATLKTLSIPVGNPVRRICVQAKDRAITLGGTFSELEVRCNEGEYSPVIVKSMFDWTQSAVGEYDLNNEIGGIDFPQSGEWTDLPYWFSYYQTVHATNYQKYDNTVAVLGLITAPARLEQNSGADFEAVFSLRGYGFQKCLRIGFDHEHDGFDLLDTRALGSLDLLVTEAAQDKTAAMFVQDIISY